jgi:hypothetical protein
MVSLPRAIRRRGAGEIEVGETKAHLPPRTLGGCREKQISNWGTENSSHKRLREEHGFSHAPKPANNGGL